MPDYVPLIEAVRRAGPHVVVGFFGGHRLNPEIRISADEFVELTAGLVSSWQQALDQQERDRKVAAATEQA
jgi:hypothetical protein